SAFPTMPTIVDCIRVIKWEASSASDGNIQRGKTSVGKAATAAATGLESVPEQVTLSVPIFDNSFMPKPYDVRCALEIFEDTARLQLFPLPGEIEKAYARAEADLCQSLHDLLGAESKVPVYLGTP